MKTFVLMKGARKFVSSWVDPQGLCFVTNKAIQKPWVKDIKLMKNSPSLAESMNSRDTISKFAIEVE